MRRSPTVLVLLCLVALLTAACGTPKDTGFPPTPTPTENGETEVDESTLEDPAELHGAIEVADNKYIPRYVAVDAGTTVTWVEVGDAPHNVVSVEKGLFDSNPDCLQDISTCMAKGEEFSFTFDEPGEYAYYCVIHGRATALEDPANMAGFVIVR